MVKLSSSGEVGQFSSETQFGPDGNTSKCGYFSAADAAGSAAPGGQPWTADAVTASANQHYEQFGEPDGMTQATLHTDLATYGITGKDINPDWITIKSNLNAGYPVIICLPETQVFDKAIGGSPYPWNSTGFDHIILLTGIAPDGNVLVRDSANITAPNTIRSGPRTYIIANMSPYWATAVTPAWKIQEEEDMPAASFTDATMRNYFVADGARWKCKNNGMYMGGAIAAWYARYGGVAVFGLPISNEDSTTIPGVIIQRLERGGVVVYDPKRLLDRPPTNEPCYLIHIDPGSKGQAILAQSLITPLQNQINQLKAIPTNTALIDEITVLKNKIAQAATLLKV
jgi:hypothetical protein